MCVCALLPLRYTVLLDDCWISKGVTVKGSLCSRMFWSHLPPIPHARKWTQDLAQARQVFYHQVTLQPHSEFSKFFSLLLCFFFLLLVIFYTRLKQKKRNTALSLASIIRFCVLCSKTNVHFLMECSCGSRHFSFLPQLTLIFHGGACSHQLVLFSESDSLVSFCFFFFKNVSLSPSLLLVHLHFLIPWVPG
jgi:hypothetical protein